jgi:nicotinate-nucleotide adenylyltransferase
MDTSYDAPQTPDVWRGGFMTRLCFGGSFNPLHIGHLLVARAVAEARNFQKIVLIPSAQPPHKPTTYDLAKSCHRLEMCQAVSRGDPLFEVEPLELERTGPSYTIDTVRELAHRGWGRVSWLIGADMLQILPKWHEAHDLLREVDFVVARRPGSLIDWGALPPEFRVLQANVVDTPLIQISATEIRERLRAGRSIRYLVPPEVEQYIRDHHLYGA